MASIASMIEYYKQAFFDLLDSVNPPAKYKVLVLDNYTSSIICGIFEDGEILNRQVASIEIIDSPRPKVGLEAIYFVQPSFYNVDCITADFTRLPRRYDSANVFFLPLAGPQINGIIQKLKSGNANRFLKRLEEAYLDFRPTESQVFTLGDSQSLEKLFNPQCHDLIMSTISQTASQLVSVCVTLGEYPIVRFYKPSVANYEGHILSYMIAQEFQKQMDDYARSHPEFLGDNGGPTDSKKRARSLFIITDRSVDFLAPILHEFTFQASIYDILPFKDWKCYKSTIPGANGTPVELEGSLSEKDPEWVSLRHSLVQEAKNTLEAKRKKLRDDNPNFEDKSKQANINDIKGMMLGLSSYIDQRDRLFFYTSILILAINNITDHETWKLAVTEQTLATGVTIEGSKPKAITDEFIACLANEKLMKSDKLRLVIVYTLFRGGVIEQDLTRLQHHCGFNEHDLQVIKNYQKLGAHTLKESPKVKLSKHDMPQRFHSDRPVDGQYISSRYVPGLFNILDMLLTGKLPPVAFPFIKDQPTEDTDEDTEAGANSLRSRNQRPNWALNPSSTKVARQRVFVFVAGGITASEVKACYDLSDKHSREIIIGSGNYTSPTQFLTSLGNLSKDRRELGLKADKPVSTKAPAFLYENERIGGQPQQQQQAQAKPAQQPSSKTGPTPSQTMATSSIPKPEEKKKGKFSKFLKSSKK